MQWKFDQRNGNEFKNAFKSRSNVKKKKLPIEWNASSAILQMIPHGKSLDGWAAVKKKRGGRGGP